MQYALVYKGKIYGPFNGYNEAVAWCNFHKLNPLDVNISQLTFPFYSQAVAA